MAHEERKGGLGDLIFSLLVICAIFCALPGVLFMALFKEVSGIPLDLGQMWTFAFVVALGFYFLLALLRRSFIAGLKVYLLVCVFILLAGLVGHFGFKVPWPAAIVIQFIPENL